MEYAAYATVALGLVLVLVRGGQLIGATLEADKFGEMVAKLCRATNYERALKLCNAAPKAVVAMVMRAGVSEMIRTGSPATADAGFEAARVDQQARLFAGRALGLAGIALALAAAGLATAHGFDRVFDQVCGTALAVVFVGGWTLLRERTLVKNAMEAWHHQVLPALHESAQKAQ